LRLDEAALALFREWARRVGTGKKSPRPYRFWSHGYLIEVLDEMKDAGGRPREARYLVNPGA
jgi:hypothetical protein